MTNKILLTAFLMILSLNVYSQYPYKSIINNDTVFILSKQQFINVNINIADNKKCTELLEVCESENIILHNQIVDYINIGHLQSNNIELMNDVIIDKDSIINIKTEQFNIINIDNDNDKLHKHQLFLIGGISILTILLIISII